MNAVHWLDHSLSLMMARRRLFSEGWGNEEQLDLFSSGLELDTSPAPLALTWSPARAHRNIVIRDGTFASPVAELPRPVRRGHVRALLPRVEHYSGARPTYVSLASSGEEGFAVRMRLFAPLVEQHGIGVLLLESPFYGLRRPPGQRGSAVRTVSEHMVMNFAMVQECLGLLERLAEEGHTRLGLTGFSMGGAMAALATSVTRHSVAAAIFSAGRAPKYAFTAGLLTRSIDFELLGRTAGGSSNARARLRRLFATADLDRHPVPRCPQAAVIVGGRRDGYVSATEVQRLHTLWKGSEVRWLDTGHVGTMLRHPHALRQAAVDAMERVSAKRAATFTTNDARSSSCAAL